MKIYSCNPGERPYVTDDASRVRYKLHFNSEALTPVPCIWGDVSHPVTLLALAILEDVFGHKEHERCIALMQRVKHRLLKDLPVDRGWTITETKVRDTITEIEKVEEASRGIVRQMKVEPGGIMVESLSPGMGWSNPDNPMQEAPAPAPVITPNLLRKT